MAELHIALTPPRAGSVQAKMSPNSFITSSATAKNIKRKASLNISPSKLKRFALKPPPTPEDLTILDYATRTLSDVSNSSSQLSLVSNFDLVLDGVKDLKKRVKDLEREVDEGKTRIAELKHDVEDLKSAQVAKDDADAQFRAESAEDANGRIELLMANLVIDLAKYAARSLHQDHLCHSHSTHALEQFASRIPELELGKAGIPTKHWDLLRKMPRKLFDELEDEFVKLIQADSAQTSALQDFKFDEEQYSYKVQIEQDGNTHSSDSLPSLTAIPEFAKLDLHDDYIEHILSLGLPFLRRLFNADRQEKMRLVLDNTSVNRQGFFSKAFRIWRMRASSRHDWEYDEIPSEGLESIRGPNAGYRWAKEGLGSVAGIGYVCRLRGGLRYLGCTFWNTDRLRTMGILQQTVYTVDKRSCGEKVRARRMDRRSAETRLKRYFHAKNWSMAMSKVDRYLE
ncbi:MAG: hypothetical protein Q9191_002822 [Dirinaria sp. TL-2023a]